MSVPVDSFSPCSCDVSCKGRMPLVRRALLKGALDAGRGLTSTGSAFAQEPRMARPDKGDLLVFASSDKAGEFITPADLPVRGTS